MRQDVRCGQNASMGSDLSSWQRQSHKSTAQRGRPRRIAMTGGAPVLLGLGRPPELRWPTAAVARCPRRPPTRPSWSVVQFGLRSFRAGSIPQERSRRHGKDAPHAVVAVVPGDYLGSMWPRESEVVKCAHVASISC
jgi:hypothetical protein